tara:strand:+ start:414 stop:611 length:198 start_codon:yes stop_codon:yes gene_type:complete
MDDTEKIDRLIETMHELKELTRQLEDPRIDMDMILGAMIALIICTDVPDVTILPTSSITNEIAQA